MKNEHYVQKLLCISQCKQTGHFASRHNLLLHHRDSRDKIHNNIYWRVNTLLRNLLINSALKFYSYLCNLTLRTSAWLKRSQFFTYPATINTSISGRFNESAFIKPGSNLLAIQKGKKLSLRSKKDRWTSISYAFTSTKLTWLCLLSQLQLEPIAWRLRSCWNIWKYRDH